MIADALATFLLSPRNALEDPSVPLSSPKAWEYLSGGTKSASGVRVSHHSSLSVAAVWQAVAIISGDAAMLPFHVFRRLERNFREVDVGHPADMLISRRPNAEMWANEFWRRHLLHSLLWQNGYIYVQRYGGVGKPIGLFNLLPDRTCSRRNASGGLEYVTEASGRLVTLRADEVIHTKGLSINNEEGIDLVSKARDAWGLALAAQGFASKFFANGAGTGGILEIPSGFTQNAMKNLEEGFRDRVGEDNWFKTAILREGAKFHATTIKPRDSQLNEVSESQVRQVARFFNLPPFKLGLSDSVSYNSSEQAQLVYLTSCLRHWLEAVVGSCSLRLLSEAEIQNGSHFLAHNTTALLETDVKTLNDVLNIQRTAGVINANDWRAKLNMSPRTDPDADSYGNPNTTPGPAPKGSSDGEEESTDSRDAQQRLVRHAAARIGRLIANQLKGTDAEQWRKMKLERTRAQFRDELRPVADVLSRDGASLCEQWESEFFAGVESLLKPECALDRTEALELLFPAALAARLGA